MTCMSDTITSNKINIGCVREVQLGNPPDTDTIPPIIIRPDINLKYRFIICKVIILLYNNL